MSSDHGHPRWAPRQIPEDRAAFRAYASTALGSLLLNCDLNVPEPHLAQRLDDICSRAERIGLIMLEREGQWFDVDAPGGP